MTIAAVIATRNRLNLLKACINAVCYQTYKPDAIIVVNNGSTDGTTEWLDSQTDLLVVHQENLGGAGGFYTGIKTAYEKGHDWIWVMDDDAEPELHCLETLVRVGLKENYTYVPVAVDLSTKKLSWCIAIVDKYSGKRKYIKDEELSHIDDKTFETYGPGFLGSLFHRQVVKLVGYPNPELFIRGDDEEFGLRVQKAGFKSLVVKDAVIYHPTPKNYRPIVILGRKTYYSSEAPWKAFYYARNSIYIIVHVERNLKAALRRSIFILGTLLFEDQKLKRIPLYTRAIYDGFLGKLGKTITPP